MKEVDYELMLYFYMHSTVNGCGNLRRQFATGNTVADLVVEMPREGAQGPYRCVVELKILRTKRECSEADLPEEALKQVTGYADKLGIAADELDAVHLVFFCRYEQGATYPTEPEVRHYGGRQVTCWRVACPCRVAR